MPPQGCVEVTHNIFTIFDDARVSATRTGDECEITTLGMQGDLHLLGSVDAVRRWYFRAMRELEATADSWVDNAPIDETATE